jgi:hypothetical protein
MAPCGRGGTVSTRPVSDKGLTATQKRVLYSEHGGCATFIARVHAILRERGLEKQWDWTIGELMSEIEHECGERLVSVSCIQRKDAASGGRSALDITLGYSIDTGGRYFIALQWQNLPWPLEMQQQQALGEAQFKWVDVHFRAPPPPRTPQLFHYVCQCKL